MLSDKLRAIEQRLSLSKAFKSKENVLATQSTATGLGSTSANAAQSTGSQLLGLLFTLGIEAASIFVKNPNHQATAGAIITALGNILPELESLI